VTIEQIVYQQTESVNVKQIANQQQRKEKSMLKDEEQGLWCVAQTSYVDQKRFAKQGLDLDFKNMGG